MAHVFVEHGPDAGKSFKLSGDRMLLGRGTECEALLRDARCSRKHARFVRTAEGWSVEDLGSSNGTHVNGERLDGSRALAEGDRVVVGNTSLRFSKRPRKLSADAPTPKPVARKAAGVGKATVQGPAAPASPATVAARKAEAAAPEGKRPSEGLRTLPADRKTLLGAPGGGMGPTERDLRTLLSLARVCAEAGSAVALLDALAGGLSGALAADRVFPLLHDEILGALDVPVGSQSAAQRLADAPISHAVAEEALSKNAPVLMVSREDDRFKERPSLAQHGIATALAVPIAVRGAGGDEETVGVLYADRLGSAESFGERDLDLAASAAHEVAGALGRARDLERARERARRAEADAAGAILGESGAIQAARDLIARAAPAPAPVLVTGESGTGKELVARAIHAGSPRAELPFETVNCAAIPAGLVESELFGHVKGAFTGADRNRPGRFESAHRGTLFLDEIGDLPLEAQAKLLRAVESGELSRVGETRARRVDVRLVAATNRDLEACVREGSFREDLFYRLNVLRLHLAPLRERGDDVELLAAHFLARACARAGRAPLALSTGAAAALRTYTWPGNVRELANLMERCSILVQGKTIELADLPPEVRGEAPGTGAAGEEESSVRLGAPLALDAIERAHIESVLDACKGNKKRAAEILAIDRSTLYARLRAWEGAPPDTKEDASEKEAPAEETPPEETAPPEPEKADEVPVEPVEEVPADPIEEPAEANGKDGS